MAFNTPKVSPSVEPTTVPTGTPDLAAALAMLAESQVKMTQLMEQQAAYNKAALKIAPRRKKTMGEFLAERHQKGLSKFLPHLVYQNGREVNPSGLSKETIATLDTLVTGKYCDGMVDVIRISDGPEGINSRIHLCYNNGTTEERMTFYMRFPTFTKLVQDIADDMKAQNRAPVIEKGRDAPEFEFPDELKELV
jgi:hypothetical protein